MRNPIKELIFITGRVNLRPQPHKKLLESAFCISAKNVIRFVWLSLWGMWGMWVRHVRQAGGLRLATGSCLVITWAFMARLIGNLFENDSIDGTRKFIARLVYGGTDCNVPNYCFNNELEDSAGIKRFICGRPCPSSNWSWSLLSRRQIHAVDF